MGYSFCPKTGQVTHYDDKEEEDIFEGFCTSTSPALTANARANGTIIEDDYDGNLDDIDLDNANKPALKINMQITFNVSNPGDGGGYNDRHSVVTLMTAVSSNATNVINQSNRRDPYEHKRRTKHSNDNQKPRRPIDQHNNHSSRYTHNNKQCRQRCLHVTDWSKG